MNVKIRLLSLVTTAFLIACSQEPTVSPSAAKSEARAPAPVAVATSPAASANLPAKLCDVLKKVAPEVRDMAPVGAQAQLVMAIASAFDVNAAALQEVAEKIDSISSQSCSAEREMLLSVLKMKTLQEAVR